MNKHKLSLPHQAIKTLSLRATSKNAPNPVSKNPFFTRVKLPPRGNCNDAPSARNRNFNYNGQCGQCAVSSGICLLIDTENIRFIMAKVCRERARK